ncbi:hypothetical protein SUGI_0577280 [Cryptomeria japonica]|uniref:receptor-like protein 51 n=1 Tax=Cryptomeria japonica TaxID=3369 RepID=UPI0024089C5F|nr:receptor-like protein 51 [Cryptomeria japonica]XP_057825519.2 receptor-like protein 51 [Cryptomeria japonica]XP_057825520.2 receptor-like protein 51 [Cryptomeria japonica]XP_057825521.2 receptor-like protein 51 [Cryptomeria japonica]GLJ29274.1 hypothetical protein SUGI_0577280 [Cryptomeria japonica]
MLKVASHLPSGTGHFCLMILVLLLPNVASTATSSRPSFALSKSNTTKEAPSPIQSPTPAPKPKGKTHPAASHTPAAAPSPKPHKGKTHAAASNAPAAAPALAPVHPKAKAPTPHKPTITNGTLDPAQVKALRSLGVTVEADACNTDVQQLLICDNARGPLKHLISLELQYCSPNAPLSSTALSSLSTLQSLSFVDCPMKVTAPLPPKLAESLSTFSCSKSLGRTVENKDLPTLSGIWLSKLQSLKELSVKDVVVNGSGSGVGAIMGNMSKLEQVTFSNTNISGTLPKSWPRSLTALQISQSMIKGNIPPTMSNLTLLQSLDLSLNNLTGHIPAGFGSLKNLQSLSLSSNRLTGNIPAGFKNLTLLSYLDLSNNHLNGTVPAFIGNIKGLRYLDLRNNKFHGVLPFSTAFVKNLNTFKVGGNPELCFNDSILLSTISGGADPCDSKGRPSKANADQPAFAPDEFAPTPTPLEDAAQSPHKKNKPKTVVLAVSIALASLVFVIIVAVVVSRRCARRD